EDIQGDDLFDAGACDSPAQRLFLYLNVEFFPPQLSQLLGIVEAFDATLGVENDRGGEHVARERAAPYFVGTGDALSRRWARHQQRQLWSALHALLPSIKASTASA